MIADHELIDKIKNFRKSHNLSVKDFARICNIGERVIYRVESGVSVHKSTIKIIIRAISLSDDDCHRLIKYYDDNERYLSYKRNNMQKEYRRNNRDRINAYARMYAHNYRVNNPIEARERDRIRREKNREKLRAYNREYQRNRRARLKANADSRATSEALENSAPVIPVPRTEDD